MFRIAFLRRIVTVAALLLAPQVAVCGEVDKPPADRKFISLQAVRNPTSGKPMPISATPRFFLLKRSEQRAFPLTRSHVTRAAVPAPQASDADLSAHSPSSVRPSAMPQQRAQQLLSLFGESR